MIIRNQVWFRQKIKSIDKELHKRLLEDVDKIIINNTVDNKPNKIKNIEKIR